MAELRQVQIEVCDVHLPHCRVVQAKVVEPPQRVLEHARSDVDAECAADWSDLLCCGDEYRASASAEVQHGVTDLDVRELNQPSAGLDGGKRKAVYGVTRQDIAEKLAAALQAREQGMLVTGPRQTVGQFLTRWLEDSVKPSLRPRSYVVYDAKIRNHVLPELGNVALTSLTPQHLQRLYARRLAAGYSPTTINLVHTVPRPSTSSEMATRITSALPDVGRNLSGIRSLTPRLPRQLVPARTRLRAERR